MKKTLAAVGASVLGLGAAAVPVSGAAAAPPPALEPCEDFYEQISALGDFNEQWIGDCIPQYGLGKVEFTIVPDEDNPSTEFPEGFEPLPRAFEEDSPVTGSTTLDREAMEAYFDLAEDSPLMLPISPVTSIDESATHQTYFAIAFTPITGTGLATPDNTPTAVSTACGITWDETGLDAPSVGWYINFAPIDTTYSQTIDGTEWAYTIEGHSKPTYIFFAFDEVDEVAYLCATDGETVLSGPLDVMSLDDFTVYVVMILAMPFLPESLEGLEGLPSVDPTTGALPSLDELAAFASSDSFAAIGESGLFDLGTFGPNQPDGPQPQPQRQIAATGANAADLVVPAAIAAGVVVIGGTLIGLTVVRRRRAKS